jgi:hypothetical protein
MKRYFMFLAALIAVSALAYNYQTILGQQPETRRGVTAGAATPAITEAPKGKVLVEELPEGTEGVVLEKGIVKTKPGYKFVRKDKQVMVMRIGGGATGGRGIGGSWNCNCEAGGASGCEVASDDHVVYCRKTGSACSERCVMSITIKGLKSQILQY